MKQTDESRKAATQSNKETFLDILVQGISQGILLFTSSLLILRAVNSEEGLSKFMNSLFLFFAGYLVLGILLQFIRSLPELNFKWLRGLALFYWVDIIFVILAVAARFISSYFRYMILINAAVIIVLRIIDYRYLYGMAKEMNLTKRGKSLVIDLKEHPKTKEEFFQVLEDYCIKNSIALTYINRDIPATVELDGVRHKVELSLYYTYGGPIYTLDISQDE